MVQKLRIEHRKDQWFLFAKRRMSNTLKDQHYRPPELLAFLDEEAGLDTKGKTDEKKD